MFTSSPRQGKETTSTGSASSSTSEWESLLTPGVYQRYLDLVEAEDLTGYERRTLLEMLRHKSPMNRLKLIMNHVYRHLADQEQADHLFEYSLRIEGREVTVTTWRDQLTKYDHHYKTLENGQTTQSHYVPLLQKWVDVAVDQETWVAPAKDLTPQQKQIQKLEELEAEYQRGQITLNYLRREMGMATPTSSPSTPGTTSPNTPTSPARSSSSTSRGWLGLATGRESSFVSLREMPGFY